MLGTPQLLVSLSLTAALASLAAQVEESSAESSAPEGAIVLEGKALCVDATGAVIADERCRVDGGAEFVFETDDGARVSFLEGDPQAEMMVDPRVRERRLRITGWPRAEGGIELLHVHSLHRHGAEARAFEIDYRCDVCDITATAPGPCWCCGEELTFRETPLAGDG